jgi:hypothetical protein
MIHCGHLGDGERGAEREEKGGERDVDRQRLP